MKIKAEPFIHALIWLTGFLVFSFGVKTIGGFHRDQVTLLVPVLYGTALNVALFYLTSLLFIPQFASNKNGWILFAKVAGLLLISSALETLTDIAFFESIYSSADESFRAQFFLNLTLNAIVLSTAMAYGFTKNWIRNERQKQRLKEEKLLAEFSFLKAQINPHFLFNVLNMAYSTSIKAGDEVTSGIIEKLAELMRYMLYESNSDRVELTKELSFLKGYVELQKLRLSSDIPVRVELDLPDSVPNRSIGPLLLIPFVENAFKYGLKYDEPSEILINLTLKDDHLSFRVKNTLFENTRAPLPLKGIGLENVRKRLSLLYPGRHQLICREWDGYYLVELELTLNE